MNIKYYYDSDNFKLIDGDAFNVLRKIKKIQ